MRNISTIFFFLAVATGAFSQELPTIELDYSVYRAYSYNETAQTYKFKNVRYADPPVGKLRWAPPTPPSLNQSLQDGSAGTICYQAPPRWARTTYINNMTVSQFSQAQSEDCLFLDVVVPKNALSNSEHSYQPGSNLLPVMVWIPGGGFTSGSKDPYSSDGLMERGSNSFIFVGINYRIGAFGWLGGPLLRSQGGTSNVGFLDQVAALQWVQKYIRRFGGDPANVTILGESAGGSSITHHLTARGGVGNPGLFRRAIVQSAGHLPKLNASLMDKTFVSFARDAGCANTTENMLLECIRSAPINVLAQTNRDSVGRAPYGQFTYGPVVDGTYVTENPQILLAQGRFDESVSTMVSHNGNEGLSFIPPNITTEADFLSLVSTTLSTASQDTWQTIVNEVYPESDFLDHAARARAFGVEMSGFFCSVNWYADAFLNNTYNYVFDITPGTHGQDLPYTFWRGKIGKQQDGMIMTDSVDDPAAATWIQKYIGNFVTGGNPNGKGLPEMPLFADEGLQLSIQSGGAPPQVMDEGQRRRCRWWQLNRDY